MGKVMALYKAGWNYEQIAYEMHTTRKKIYMCIYHQKNKEGGAG